MYGLGQKLVGRRLRVLFWNSGRPSSSTAMGQLPVTALPWKFTITTDLSELIPI
ncbi:MAG: hypothetical protein ILP18_04150 [Treponema sp.]|nr:hypothetical protein [Treponema sp.]